LFSTFCFFWDADFRRTVTMGLLRSETMREGLLVLPNTEGLARVYLNAIGQETSIQFEDMNASTLDAQRRPYRHHVQRIEEMERILRYLFEEMNRMGCPVVKARAENFLEADKQKAYKLDEVEAELKGLYKQWVALSANDEQLAKERNQVAEEVEVVTLAEKMTEASGQGDAGSDAKKPLLRMLNAISGVINFEDQARFSRAVWRASRGNTFTHFSGDSDGTALKMIDPKDGKTVGKTVFVIFFQGSSDSQSALRERIVKVCSTFGCSTYAWPDSVEVARKRRKNLEENLRQRTATLEQCEDLMREEAKLLVSLAGPGRSSRIEEFRNFCTKEKSLYAVLNMFEGTTHLRANIWFAESEEAKIKEVLQNTRGANSEHAAHLHPVANSKKEPPTYIRTNDFTDPWQVVINTYGFPRYQEANPALFACVTFPFIFGMMYGDVGHGFLVFLFGLWLVNKGKALQDIPSVGNELYWARYLVLQLGVYATFAGFMYNDLFSVGLPIFSSGYAKDEAGNWLPTWDIKNEGNGQGGPYPIGVDWAWHGSTNELMFMNSLKMKLSVLFGVLQMTLGVFLRFGNSIFFKSKIDFVFECIPMLIFMLCFFGWMDFMILYKWVYPIDAPPGIINSLICMAMGPMGVGQTDEFPLWHGEGGSWSSVKLSTFLMNLAVLSVPWLLFFKPLCLKIEHGKAEQAEKGTKVGVEDAVEAASGGHGHGHGHGEEFNFGEIIIHQVIETIEYVLGTVSHTASYLRIWALSLAHQQLSLVFYQKTIGMALTASSPLNGIAIYIMFTVWFAITAAVLLGMDVLECFLHTLRLHWVEFDSKFFKADGYNFEPYSCRACIQASND